MNKSIASNYSINEINLNYDEHNLAEQITITRIKNCIVDLQNEVSNM